MHIEFIARKTPFRTEKWYFRIVSSNRKVLATSEKYHNLEDCVNAAHLVAHMAIQVKYPPGYEDPTNINGSS